MEVLRLFTAGNVDDGKSTLIGRLLLDSKAISTDILHQLSQSNTDKTIDLAFVTDGLRAERAMGITIDVAYKYFTTLKRKFILIDTPGHQEYTRNMYTGASVCQVAIILLDVSQEITNQTLKHIEIVGVLGIEHVIFAINKMDKVSFNEEAFLKCKAEISSYINDLIPDATFHFIPISALEGDNVVHKSQHATWYVGPTFLDLLNEIEILKPVDFQPFVMEIQGVLSNSWVYAKVLSGKWTKGQSLLHNEKPFFLPKDGYVSGLLVNSFVEGDEVCFAKIAGSSIERGQRIFSDGQSISTVKYKAKLCWMSSENGKLEKFYKIRKGTWEGKVKLIANTSDILLNQIIEISLENDCEMVCFQHLIETKKERFILIDLDTFATVAAGIITEIN